MIAALSRFVNDAPEKKKLLGGSMVVLSLAAKRKGGKMQWSTIPALNGL
jgi:hypothetical protein